MKILESKIFSQQLSFLLDRNSGGSKIEGVKQKMV